MKIVIIGAGSMSFSPSLFNSVTRDPALADCELGLVDVDAEALEIAERLCCRLVKERGLQVRVQASTDRRDVLGGANAVTTTISVGGLETFRRDIEIPARYGCIQPVGDTSGPGGLSRILRHVPEMVAIAEDMADLCPSATLYNYTNPLTALTRAVLKHTPVECIGLCIGPELTWRYICSFIGVKTHDTWARVAGINHCHWLLELRRGTEDLLPWIGARLAQMRGDTAQVEALSAGKSPEDAPPTDPFAGQFQPLSFALFEQLGYYPGPGDPHVAEFYPQLIHAPGRAAAMNIEDGRVVTSYERHHPAFFEKMRQQALGEAPLSEDMFGEHSYGEESQLTAILAARRDHKPFPLFVNVTNNGTISNLPDEAVVEVPCVINSSGVTPLRVGPLPQQCAITDARAVMNVELAIEAAMRGSRELAVQAYLNDPYCTDIEAAPKLVNELIDAQMAVLPRFGGK